MQEKLDKLKRMLSSPPGVSPDLTWWELVDVVDFLGTLPMMKPRAEELLLQLLEYGGTWPLPAIPTHAMPPEELVKHRALLLLLKQWEKLTPLQWSKLDTNIRAAYLRDLRKMEEEAVSRQLKEIARRLVRLVESYGI